MLQFSAPHGAIVEGWCMGEQPAQKRFRFEDKTSEIARVIDLPADAPGASSFKAALRAFLALLGELARGCWT